MTRICNFPTSKDGRCKHHVADDRPNCGRHRCEISADQLGPSPTVYRKGNELHVWAGEPDGFYCLVHSDLSYQALCQVAGEAPPCCLREGIEWRDEHGEFHRDDGPAVIEADGTQRWFQHGWLHRDDDPAVIYASGMRIWYQHGKLHRDDGPAQMQLSGTRSWWQHGERHREDGPAFIGADGVQAWYVHNEMHRDDGPAFIGTGGEQAWFWHGTEVTEQEHARLRKRSLGT